MHRGPQPGAAVHAPVAVETPVQVVVEALEDAYDGPLAQVIQLRPEHPAAVEPAEPMELIGPIEPVGPIETAQPVETARPVETADPEPAAEIPPVEAVAVESVAQVEPTAQPQPAPATGGATRKPAARRAGAEPAAAPLDEELTFTPWKPRSAGDRRQLDRLSDPAVAKVVRRLLTSGLKAEGPVHRDRLARLTAGAFGLTRVTEARRDALLALLPANATLAGDFVWPASLDRATWSSFRRQASSVQRPLEHVAPEEIGNAMVALARASADLTKDDLYQRTAEVFGHRRRTAAQLPLLDAAFAAVLAADRRTGQPDGAGLT
jgi:hypothetical protein